MGHSQFVAFFLVLTLLVLSFSQGYGRILRESPFAEAVMPSLKQETPRKSRFLAVELLDYGSSNVGPNVNSRSGFPFNLPSSPLLPPAEQPTID
uniref:Uncharacterized protein n=1 Tax=Chenopodium quinoa TaxID=63459 RepID=A0A803N3F0_CHEQI